MPYVLQTRVDRTLASIGLVQKTISVGGYFVTVRRCTVDTNFVQNVLVNQEYFRYAYTPNPRDTIIDIGANIGTFVLAAAAHAAEGHNDGADVEMFELQARRGDGAVFQAFGVWVRGDGGVEENPVAAEFHRRGHVARGAHAGVHDYRVVRIVLLQVLQADADVVGVEHALAAADGAARRHHAGRPGRLEPPCQDRVVTGVDQHGEPLLCATDGCRSPGQRR